LNLIEQIFAKLKHMSREAAARSVVARSKLAAPLLPRSSLLLPSTNPQTISKNFGPCIDPTAVMHAARTRSRAINSAWVRGRNTLPEKQ
jgi:hypothetical protein